MNKSYSDIELTDTEMEIFDNINSDDVLNSEATMPQTPAIEAEEQQTEETSIEATENLEVDANSVMIDGESYDLDTINKWREDSTNKDNWQKSNTEKSQQLAKWNKFAEKLNSDETFKEHVKDYFFDDTDQIAKLGLDGEIEIDRVEEELQPQTELEDRLQNLESIESERVIDNRVEQLDNSLTTLESQYPEFLGESKTDAFLEYAETNAEMFVENGIPNLQKAFQMWSFDAMQEQITHLKKLDDNRLRNKGRVVNNSEMAVQETKTPKSYKSYSEVNMDDPEIAKFFE